MNDLPNETSNSTRGLISIGKAAKFLGVSEHSLRNWEEEGKLIPVRTAGGSRRYRKAQLRAFLKTNPRLAIKFMQKHQPAAPAAVVAAEAIAEEIVQEEPANERPSVPSNARSVAQSDHLNVTRIIYLNNQSRLLRFMGGLMLFLLLLGGVQAAVLFSQPKSKNEVAYKDLKGQVAGISKEDLNYVMSEYLSVDGRGSWDLIQKQFRLFSRQCNKPGPFFVQSFGNLEF